MQEVRLIDANALMKRVCEKECGPHFNIDLCDLDDDSTDTRCVFREYVRSEPTVEAEPVRHGRWIPTEYDSYADGAPVWDKWECSECGHEHNGEEDTLTAFCPKCGARMDATDTNVGGKGDEEMDLSPLDFLAAEYDRKHPQGIRFVDCMEGADDGACKKV